MRIIKKSTLRTYGQQHADAKGWLAAWVTAVEAADWRSINDVRKLYKSADRATTASGKPVVIFDVKGDRYRLIVAVHFNTQRVYIRDFMTHEAYNSQRWKHRH